MAALNAIGQVNIFENIGAGVSNGARVIPQWGLDRPEFIASGQYLERKMPHAHLEVVVGGEHSMHEDSHAVDVVALIQAFIARLP